MRLIEKEDQLRPFFLVSAYTIGKSYCASAHLKGEFATLWFNIQGEREVVALPGGVAQTLYNESVPEASRPKDIPKLRAAIRAHICGLSEDGLAGLLRKTSVFVTTFKAREAMYMPAGYVVFERALTSTTGFPQPVLVPSQIAGLEAIAADGLATSALAAKLIEQHNESRRRGPA